MMATGRRSTYSWAMGSPVRGFTGPVYSSSGVGVGMGSGVRAGRECLGAGETWAVGFPQAPRPSSKARQSGASFLVGMEESLSFLVIPG